MSNYLLDTNIIIAYARENETANDIEKKFQLYNGINKLAVSAVVLGELDSIIHQFQYGVKKTRKIEQLLMDVYTLKINTKPLIKRYGEIDAYSQGKLANKPLQNSARNMGKNDIWIAATASIYDLTLLTTDKDFNHLHDTYLDLNYIDLSTYMSN